MDLKAEDLAFFHYLKNFITPHKQVVIERVLCKRTRFFSLVLENIYKPHNAGAVVRTADCFGIQDLHVIEKEPGYKINPYVSRGAGQWVDIHRHQATDRAGVEACFDLLRKKGYTIVVTSPQQAGSIPLADLHPNQPIALVFGNEHEGVSEAAKKAADGLVHIPMSGFTESFNISVSAAICLYALQQKLPGQQAPELDESEKMEIRYRWYQQLVKNIEAHRREFFR